MSEQHGIFIDVEISGEAATDAEVARKLEEVCPVDIFKAGDSGTEVVRENLDECVLCELCLEAAAAGDVVVKKLYDGTELRRADA
jgi:NAD-dependent dihydropyrimidine dehydrogenase PreA subunit